MAVELRVIKIEKPAEVNVILGQSHFIKTVEDLHEALAGAVPGIRFGLAFCEASGPCLVRASGTDPDLVTLARRNALAVGCGHFFIIALGNCFPINVLPQVRACPEVCAIFGATANPCALIVAETDLGRAIVGVIDGSGPKGAETDEDVRSRKALLRRFGYKLALAAGIFSLGWLLAPVAGESRLLPVAHAGGVFAGASGPIYTVDESGGTLYIWYGDRVEKYSYDLGQATTKPLYRVQSKPGELPPPPGGQPGGRSDGK